MDVVNVHEAKTHFSKLLARAHTGEEIIIGKAGKPYAKLVPLSPVKEPVPGVADEAVSDSFKRSSRPSSEFPFDISCSIFILTISNFFLD